MHPLRFPNSSIKAKRGGGAGRGWPQGAADCSQGPCKWAAGHGQPPCRGDKLQPRPPCKGAASQLQGATARRGNSPQGAATRWRGCQRCARKGRLSAATGWRGCQRRARKGRSSAANPQEVAHGTPVRGCRQQGWRRRPQGWPPLGRATVGRNVQHRRLRRGNDGAGG
ncbi:hypothetical protein GW17_00036358 [Ensete ventricosum]|nr:hypothetical protein GW17_00036358 [Ensete ventricosum]